MVPFKKILMVWDNFDKNWSFKMSNVTLEDQYQCDIFATIKINTLILSRIFSDW